MLPLFKIQTLTYIHTYLFIQRMSRRIHKKLILEVASREENY